MPKGRSLASTPCNFVTGHRDKHNNCSNWFLNLKPLCGIGKSRKTVALEKHNVKFVNLSKSDKLVCQIAQSVAVLLWSESLQPCLRNLGTKTEHCQWFTFFWFWDHIPLRPHSVCDVFYYAPSSLFILYPPPRSHFVKVDWWRSVRQKKRLYNFSNFRNTKSWKFLCHEKYVHILHKTLVAYCPTTREQKKNCNVLIQEEISISRPLITFTVCRFCSCYVTIRVVSNRSLCIQLSAETSGRVM